MMIEFLAPMRLFLLLSIAPLALYLYWAEAVRCRRLTALGIATGKNIARVLGPLFVTLCLALSVARPYIGYRDVQIEAQGRDLLIAVDVSMSMLATDATPSRLEVAKRKIFDLIELSYRSKTPLRIGIVTFAGSAYRFCPLTTDMEIVRSFAENLTPELMTSLGSSLEHAINTSLQTLEQIGSTSGAVLILSDGEDLEFKADAVSDRIKDSKVPFFTLGVGLTQGVPIPLRGGRFFADQYGNIVITKLTEGTLKAIASAGGGTYQPVQITDQDLSAILNALPAASGQLASGSKVRNYNEVGPWLAAAALGSLLLALALRSPAVLFTLLLILSHPSVGSSEETSEPPTLRQAYEAYAKGDYHTAQRGFESAYRQNPQDPAVLEGLGRTYYRLGRYEEAGQLFKELEGKAKNGRDLFASSYNGGNAALLRQDFDTAISKYERALAIKPNDIAATSNLALAKKLQQQEQQKQSSSSQSTSDSSSSEQSSQNSNQRSSSKEQSSSSTSSSSSLGQSSSGSDSNSDAAEQSSQGGSSSHSSSNISSEVSAHSASEASSSSESGLPREALKPLNNLEDRPLLPKQPRNLDNPPSTGQVW